jgi:hypothetical protein
MRTSNSQRRPCSIGSLVATRSAIGYARLMITRLTIVMCLLVLGLSLGACTKCGWIWDEGPRSCHSDPPR